MEALMNIDDLMDELKNIQQSFPGCPVMLSIGSQDDGMIELFQPVGIEVRYEYEGVTGATAWIKLCEY